MNLFVLLSLLISNAWALCVSTGTTNLRSEPSSKAKITWVAGQYTPLVELSRRGSWIEVQDMDGRKHWVYNTNVTSKYVCVSVRTGTAKVRTSPGGEIADMRQFDKYTAFKRLDVSGEWYEVQSVWGTNYWIHESTVWRPVRVTNVKF
jgi:SH3-like domain-containing protein